MQIILIPKRSGKTCQSCISHRATWLLGALLLVVPMILGAGAYHLSSKLDRDEARTELISHTDAAERLAHYQQRIEQLERQASAELDVLGLQLGRMQAQLMRSDALGQRLAEMAGLDKNEFDFGQVPAMGGESTQGETQDVTLDDLQASIRQLAVQLEQEHMELSLLESAMADEELKQALDPKGWPVKGGYISSAFGYRNDPFTGRKTMHRGVDIPGKIGAPIFALAAGMVVHAGEKDGYGYLVEIDHGNGYHTRYAHISELEVAVGDRVSKGQAIAQIGSTGRSTGPHLHLELVKDGQPVNPRKRLKKSSKG